MAKKHIHRHKKMDIGSKEPYIVYRCILPDCSNFYPNYKLMLGKKGICNRCAKEMVYKASMFAKHLPLLPHCDDCTHRKGRKKMMERNVDRMMEEKFGIKS